MIDYCEFIQYKLLSESDRFFTLFTVLDSQAISKVDLIVKIDLRIVLLISLVCFS